jgi:acyl dehydratase
MSDDGRYLTWQEMKVGLQFVTMRRTIFETDLVNFVNAAGLFEPLFIDAPWVQEHSPYGARLVPAVMTYAYAEGLAIHGGGFQKSGLAFLGMDLKVVAPVIVGDTIQVTIEVTESRASSKPDRGVVTTTNTVRNQRGETVLIYTPVRLVTSEVIGT